MSTEILGCCVELNYLLYIFCLFVSENFPCSLRVLANFVLKSHILFHLFACKKNLVDFFFVININILHFSALNKVLKNSNVIYFFYYAFDTKIWGKSMLILD